MDSSPQKIFIYSSTQTAIMFEYCLRSEKIPKVLEATPDYRCEQAAHAVLYEMLANRTCYQSIKNLHYSDNELLRDLHIICLACKYAMDESGLTTSRAPPIMITDKPKLYSEIFHIFFTIIFSDDFELRILVKHFRFRMLFSSKVVKIC